VKRGEIWTAAGGGDYTGGPRPVLIVQADRFDTVQSVSVCPLTTDATEAPFFRILVEPSSTNGLAATSRVMVDKITTVRRTRLRNQVGRLSDEDLARVNRAILIFLGIASRRARTVGS
jgi:mRNA interferase MazF